jgi:hypothetical protein
MRSGFLLLLQETLAAKPLKSRLPKARQAWLIGRLVHADGDEARGLVDERVGGLEAVAGGGGVSGKDLGQERVVAHEMSDVIDRVQLGALGGAMMLMVLGVLRLAVASHPA